MDQAVDAAAMKSFRRYLETRYRESEATCQFHRGRTSLLKEILDVLARTEGREQEPLVLGVESGE